MYTDSRRRIFSSGLQPPRISKDSSVTLWPVDRQWSKILDLGSLSLLPANESPWCSSMRSPSRRIVDPIYDELHPSPELHLYLYTTLEQMLVGTRSFVGNNEPMVFLFDRIIRTLTWGKCILKKVCNLFRRWYEWWPRKGKDTYWMSFGTSKDGGVGGWWTRWRNFLTCFQKTNEGKPFWL